MGERHLKKSLILASAVLAMVAISTAKSTRLAFTWKNQRYPGGAFKNILVLAMNGQASGRAEFEDQMAAAIAKPGVQAVPSYSLLPRPESTPIDMDQQFDAIAVSRLVKYDWQYSCFRS
jgi:hypothetical protein